MKGDNRYYDKERIIEEIQSAIETALAPHGLELYSLLGTCLSLEAIASPLKKQFGRGGLGREMGRLGLKAYSASRLPCEVECIQNPSQPELNRLIAAIALVVSRSKTPVPNHQLRLGAWRTYSERPEMTGADLLKTWGQDNSLEQLYEAALGALVGGEVLERDPADTGWQLGWWGQFSNRDED